MKVKRREERDPRHDLELERLIQVAEDVVDGPIHSFHVVERRAFGSFGLGSQDLSSSAVTGAVSSTAFHKYDDV